MSLWIGLWMTLQSNVRTGRSRGPLNGLIKVICYMITGGLSQLIVPKKNFVKKKYFFWNPSCIITRLLTWTRRSVSTSHQNVIKKRYVKQHVYCVYKPSYVLKASGENCLFLYTVSTINIKKNIEHVLSKWTRNLGDLSLPCHHAWFLSSNLVFVFKKTFFVLRRDRGCLWHIYELNYKKL